VRFTSPFDTDIGYIGDQVLDGDIVPPVNDTVTSRPRSLFIQ